MLAAPPEALTDRLVQSFLGVDATAGDGHQRLGRREPPARRDGRRRRTRLRPAPDPSDSTAVSGVEHGEPGIETYRPAVDPQEPGPDGMERAAHSPTLAGPRRPTISAAARREVSRHNRSGARPRSNSPSTWATRSGAVLPEPAPATTTSGPSPWATARCWRSLGHPQPSSSNTCSTLVPRRATSESSRKGPCQLSTGRASRGSGSSSVARGCRRPMRPRCWPTSGGRRQGGATGR